MCIAKSLAQGSVRGEVGTVIRASIDPCGAGLRGAPQVPELEERVFLGRAIAA